MKYEERGIENQRGSIVRKNTLMNRIRSGWDAVGSRDGPTPAGIHSSPPRSASTVILQGQWLSLKEKYWQAEQSSMSAADLQFDCHHYLMLWTQDGGGGRRGYSQLAEREAAEFDSLSGCAYVSWKARKRLGMMEMLIMNTQ